MAQTPTQADAVVIGGGVSGLVAAVRAAQGGLRVLVLEKSTQDRYICNSRLTQGVWHCALADPLSDPAVLEARILEATANEARGDLAHAVAVDALRAVRWLQSVGVRFIKGPLDYQSFVLAPPSVTAQGRAWEGRGGDVMLRTLEGALERTGGRILRGHRATALDMGQAGVTGVRGERSDGQPFAIGTPVVVIADGGFQANERLMRQFTSAQPQALFQRNAGTGMGDGLCMAQAAGAQLTGLGPFYGHLLSRDAFSNERLSPYPFLDYVMSSAILVDKTGRRLTDEGRGGIAVANAIAQTDNPLDKVVIADEAIWNDLGKFRLMSPNPWLTREGGALLRAETLEDLAARCGVDGAGLVHTVTHYNLAVSSGSAHALHPPRSTAVHVAKPIEKAPFYAIPVCAGITYTMGGIAIDADARVLSESGGAIEGMYAVGCATGGLEGGSSAGYVGGLIKSGVTGLRAGEHMLAARRVPA